MQPIITTLRLIDGVYLGDQQAAQDRSLLTAVHATHIVNCSTGPDFFPDLNYCQITQPIDSAKLIAFINQAAEDGSSVLLHGREDSQMALTVGILYLMSTFKWSLLKTLDFTRTQCARLALSEHSFALLEKEEIEIMSRERSLSYNWTEKPSSLRELVAHNTYLNANCILPPSCTKTRPRRKNAKRITFRRDYDGEDPFVQSIN